MQKVDMLTTKEVVERAVNGTKWICVNDKNAGRIAEKRKEPLKDLYWLDSDDFVTWTDKDLFVYKR